MVTKFLGDDHVLDSEESIKLDEKADELGLSTLAKNQIESEERSKDAESMEEQMTPRDKSRYKRAHDAFLKLGDPKSAFSNIDGLQIAYPNNREVAELYVLIAVEADPAKGLSFINHSPIFRCDSAIKSIRLIELYESMGNDNEATNEERRALRGFRDNPLVHAKALERLIDLYYEDEQQQDQAKDVKAEAASFQKPEPTDDPYLHFVQAYLDNFLGDRESLAPLGDFDLAKPFLIRKQRQLKKKTNSVEADSESIQQIETLIDQVNVLNKKLEARKVESDSLSEPEPVPEPEPEPKLQKNGKSKILAFLLAVIFGPFGLFYVSNKHASWFILIMFLSMIAGGAVSDRNGEGGAIFALLFVGTYFYGIFKATKLAKSN